jgi:hypothetical protein
MIIHISLSLSLLSIKRQRMRVRKRAAECGHVSVYNGFSSLSLSFSERKNFSLCGFMNEREFSRAARDEEIFNSTSKYDRKLKTEKILGRERERERERERFLFV